MAADLYGNTYVADAALKAIEKYPAGTTSPASGKVIGSGLSAPTGVAVDGVGNLYIGDSGNVYMIPYVNGALATAQQTKIASGLGTGNLNLAADGEGDVFVADEAKKQVVEIPNPQTELMLRKTIRRSRLDRASQARRRLPPTAQEMYGWPMDRTCGRSQFLLAARRRLRAASRLR